MAEKTEGREGLREKREGWRAEQGLSSQRMTMGTVTGPQPYPCSVRHG